MEVLVSGSFGSLIMKFSVENMESSTIYCDCDCIGRFGIVDVAQDCGLALAAVPFLESVVMKLLLLSYYYNYELPELSGGDMQDQLCPQPGSESSPRVFRRTTPGS